MRGNHHDLLPRRLSAGSIPAYAGEPLHPPPCGTADEVYPRVCGGTDARNPLVNLADGLSPRMRGNRQCQSAGQGRRGAIPAYAGEPLAGWRRGHRSAVYPRVCGGTACPITGSRRSTGLSPRMRGNPVAVAPTAPPARSIPAYAGEPSGWDAARRVSQVYPRVCGGTAPETDSAAQ